MGVVASRRMTHAIWPYLSSICDVIHVFKRSNHTTSQNMQTNYYSYDCEIVAVLVTSEDFDLLLSNQLTANVIPTCSDQSTLQELQYFLFTYFA